MTERERDIAQGLRAPDGSLIGGLDALEYANGHEDFKAGNPPPPVTSTSYDLGRRRAARDAEQTADLMARLKADQERNRHAVREALAGRPDLLAEFDTRMAALDAPRQAAVPAKVVRR